MPADRIIACNAGKIHYYARNYQVAVEEYREALELDPDFRKRTGILGLAYVQVGKLDDVLSEFKAAKNLTEDGRDQLAARAYAYAKGGDSGQARNLLAQLEPKAEHKPIAYEIAAVHAALGDRDAAFFWLDRAFREHSAWRCYIKVDPRLDGLRTDHRFLAYLEKAGFPAK